MKSNQFESILIHRLVIHTILYFYLDVCAFVFFMIPVLDMYPIRNLFIHIFVLVNIYFDWTPHDSNRNQYCIQSFYLRVRFLVSFHLHPVVVYGFFFFKHVQWMTYWYVFLHFIPFDFDWLYLITDLAVPYPTYICMIWNWIGCLIKYLHSL